MPPCGGHPARDFLNVFECWFQVVPPCGGHQAYALQACLAGKVSSRAPVWGASLSGLYFSHSSTGFKSCPRVGGIHLALIVAAAASSFKSCPRVGGIFHHLDKMALELVSSRAPVWGASRIRLCATARKIGFKSCPRVGGINTHCRGCSIAKFQVVPPCGGHPRFCASVYSFIFVSSRAPVWGASIELQQERQAAKVSSRAPVWGASCLGRNG